MWRVQSSSGLVSCDLSRSRHRSELPGSTLRTSTLPSAAACFVLGVSRAAPLGRYTLARFRILRGQQNGATFHSGRRSSGPDRIESASPRPFEPRLAGSFASGRKNRRAPTAQAQTKRAKSQQAARPRVRIFGLGILHSFRLTGPARSLPPAPLFPANAGCMNAADRRKASLLAGARQCVLHA